ncbi:hypothetical protein AcW2_005536 [Taiwanofungus camphoratus]|nr:hypothetical protein AcW2_005536 [Antrodia cinnamomea]
MNRRKINMSHAPQIASPHGSLTPCCESCAQPSGSPHPRSTSSPHEALDNMLLCPESGKLQLAMSRDPGKEMIGVSRWFTALWARR